MTKNQLDKEQRQLIRIYLVQGKGHKILREITLLFK